MWAPVSVLLSALAAALNTAAVASKLGATESLGANAGLAVFCALMALCVAIMEK